jgi:hypothetical protein
VPWGKPTTFTATLTDSSLGGIPISGKRIHFDCTGVIGEVSDDNATNSSGKAISTGTAPNTVASGWTYQAHFAGDNLYEKKDLVRVYIYTLDRSNVTSVAICTDKPPTTNSPTS